MHGLQATIDPGHRAIDDGSAQIGQKMRNAAELVCIFRLKSLAGLALAIP
jgi:hypothetical protein